MAAVTVDPTIDDGVHDVENVTYAAVPDGKPWPTIKQPVYAVVLLTIAYALVVILGLVNNTLVVTAIWTQSILRTVTNFFLANLAVADILVCVIVLPITLLDNIYTGIFLTNVDPIVPVSELKWTCLKRRDPKTFTR